MRNNTLVLAGLVASSLFLSGCGCGGDQGLSGSQSSSANALGGPTQDVSVVGPANGALAASATEEVATVVTLGRTGMLTRVDLLLSQGPTAGPLAVEVRPVAGGLPDPNVVYGSAVLDGAALPPDPGMVAVDLAPLQVHVNAGQTVAVVLRSAGGSAGWWGPSSDWSPSASRARRTRASPGAPWDAWQALPSGDFSFQTWITPD